VQSAGFDFYCLNSTWQQRQIMWTKEALYVARPNETIVIDSIPLNEIHAVLEMNDDSDTLRLQQTFNRSRNSFYTEKKDDAEAPKEIDPPTISNDASFFSRKFSAKFVLQIKTALDGVVAGRTLYLSTRSNQNSEDRRQALVSTLWDAVSIAHRKALVMSRFQKVQEKIRWIQGSLVFQISMAILIMMVPKCPSVPLPSPILS
jgi:hypothetical protein